jgi:hypothetical protein
MAIVKYPYEEVNLLVDAAAVPAPAAGVFAVSSTISFPMKSIDSVEAFTNTAGTTRVVTLTPSAGAWTAGSTIKIGLHGIKDGTNGFAAQYCTIDVPAAGFANATAACNAIRAAVAAKFTAITGSGTATAILSGAGAGSLDRGKPFKISTYTDDPARTIATVVTAAGVAPLGTIAQVQAALPTATITAVHNLVKVKRTLTGDDGTSRKQLINLWVDFSTTATLAADIVAALTIVTTQTTDESGPAQIIAV